MKKSQKIRVILNTISFKTTIGQLENCMDHSKQLEAVKYCLNTLENENIQGIVTTYNGFNVQVNLI